MVVDEFAMCVDGLRLTFGYEKENNVSLRIFLLIEI